MFFRRIESKGLAHYSYLICDKNEACVIDPRRDCEVYLQEAYLQGCRIMHVLETHRNEDYVIGSVALAERSGANVWHADGQLDYSYGQSVEDGQLWKIGRLNLQAIHSPGHTRGSMSYLLHDPEGVEWMVFTGDALFAGDVGRVDLLGMEYAEEMAGLLYDTLFNRLLPLGDHVIVCPAHGAGSVCGGSITERTWTTIGVERRYNEKLQSTQRSQFVSRVAKQLERPPYFTRMEKLNLEGAPFGGGLPMPLPLPADQFAEKANGALVLDSRKELSFGAAHVPGAISIWLDGVPNFAGWFLSHDVPVLLVNETDRSEMAMRYLYRLGYDDVVGYLAGGMLAWHMAGRSSSSLRTVTVQQLCHHLDSRARIWILDVRSGEELEKSGRIADAHHIHITQVSSRLHEIPRDYSVYVFCGSGLRSMIAASLLQRQGWEDTTVVLGGLAGWNSVRCPIR